MNADGGGAPDRSVAAGSVGPVQGPAQPIPTWAQGAVLLALCGILFFVGLGDRGLAYSEGHRVGPAWDMLRAGMPWEASDAWLAPHLFGQPYLRKPPGMAWAIAASTALFGHNEFAARLPSAAAITVLCLVSWRVTTRWLGSPWGLAAGIAQAMMPFCWSGARAAEIEMLNNAGAGAAALLLADVMLRRDGPRWGSAIGAGLGVCVMVLAKGPAGIAAVGAVPIAACVVARSAQPVLRPALLWTVMIPAVVLGGLGAATLGALGRLEGAAITQSASEFLWDVREIDRILTLPVVAWGSMIPASLALLVAPWRARADEPHHCRIVRGLAVAWVVAIVGMTVAGVGNPRYTLPVAPLLPPIAAYAVMLAVRGRRVAAGVEDVGVAAALAVRRVKLARALMLGHPAVWPAVLSVGFVLFLRYYEGPRGRTSGDEAGAALGAVLDRDASAGATVWVDDLVECRPEVLLYARRWTPLLRVRWVKPLERADVAAGDIVIVRTDRHDVPEATPIERERAGALVRGAELVHEFPVHKYTFEVYRVAGDRRGGP